MNSMSAFRPFVSILLFSAAGLFASCTPAGQPADAGDAQLDFSRSQKTDGGTWEVSYVPDPDPFMSQMDFALDVTVSRVDGAKVLETLLLEPSAFMPEHGHGMLPEVQPTVADLGEGTFRVEGMNLLMGGLWEIRIDVSAGDNTERATFNVDVEGEGDHSMLDGGHMHMEDGGHLHMEDGGAMHLEDGGHMHLEDGGAMHMDAG
jgi:hypothetical protein